VCNCCGAADEGLADIGDTHQCPRARLRPKRGREAKNTRYVCQANWRMPKLTSPAEREVETSVHANHPYYTKIQRAFRGESVYHGNVGTTFVCFFFSDTEKVEQGRVDVCPSSEMYSTYK
jgi:hypothetical protein